MALFRKARASTAVATSSYAYPTPAMMAAYVQGMQGMPGSATPLAPVNTSSMGAPAIGGPMTTQGRLSFRQRVAILIAGADAGSILFPPQQPLQPIAQPFDYAGIGRQWDYPVGYNTRVPPRSGQPITFALLREMATFDIIRIMIERVKDKVISQDWAIGMKDEKAARDNARCDELTAFLDYPDKVHTWDDWARMLLEQVIVYDAPAVWLRANRGGDLYSLDILDGTLITPKIMADGRLPPPEFGPAYQQVLKGLPAVDYVQPVPRGQPVPLDPTGQPFPELYYRPRNVRVDTPYGYGPVEQILRTIQIGIAQEEWLKDYFDTGSTPDLLLGVPENWNPNQITEMQNFFDSMLVGNLQNRRKARFIPGGIDPIDTKEKALMDAAVQEWLVRVMCYAMGLNPMPFIKMMNKGQEQTHHDEAAEEGLRPWLEWFANFINTLIALKWGYRDIVFRWKEEDSTGAKEQADIDALLVDAKIYHPDEIRAKRGDAAMPPDMRGQMDVATFARTANANQLPPDQQAAADARAEVKAKAEADRAATMAATVGTQRANEKAETAALLKALVPPPAAAPVVNVAAPNITMPPINMPAIKVDAPAITLPAITMPKMGDVFVDVGSTNVKVDAPKNGAAMGKTVTAERAPDGSFVGTISDGVRRTVRSGERVARVDGNGNLMKDQ